MDKAVVLIDGEHYPPVVEEAIENIRQRHDVVALVFLGGTEKVGTTIPREMFNLPLISDKNIYSALEKSLDVYKPQTVIDLSDEPVIGYEERLRLANIALSKDCSYHGSDFNFEPVKLSKISTKPSIAIIGTGKRVGKTAVSAYACRILKDEGYEPIAVAMGRGGPKEPDVLYGAEIELTPEYLLEVAKKGKHAASDYYEDAMMSRITTVGCRRCGGGLAGEPYVSNVKEGARVANNLNGGIIIFEGSGSAVPPVYTDTALLTVGANQPLDYISGYFGPYRLLRSDLVVLTNCEEPGASKEKISEIKKHIGNIKSGLKVIETIFRPKPLERLEGKKVFFATTAPASAVKKIKGYLEEEFGCKITGISNNLSNRRLLVEELASAEKDTEILLTELKAAAVDIVTRLGEQTGKRVVFCDNEPQTVQEEDDLQKELISIAKEAITRHKNQN